MRWYRSQCNTKIAGVCAGIGESMQKDPNLVRFAYVTCLLFSFGLAVIAYFVLAFILPLKPGSKEYPRFYRSREKLWLLGIAAGLSEQSSISVTVWRLLFLFLTFISAGMFVLVYLAFGYVFSLRPKNHNITV